jgi:hypothetical protein
MIILKLFLLSIFIILTTLIGLLFSNNKKINTDQLIIGSITGIPLISVSTFLLSFIIPTKPIYLFVIFLVGYLFYFKKNIKKLKFKKIKFNWLIIFSILLSLLTITFYTYKQSYNQSTGLTFYYAPNAHDSLWHAAIQNNLKKEIPPENPIFSGINLKGYHYFTDLYFSLLSQFTQINTIELAIFYIPMLIGFTYVSSNYLLAKNIFKNPLNISLATILLSIYSTQQHLLAWLFPKATIHSSMYWLDQPATYLINPQLVLSISILNILIYFLIKNKKFSIKEIYLLSSLVGIKIYSVLVILPSFLLNLWNSKKGIKKIILPIVTGLFLLAFVLLIGSNSKQSPFFTSPGWFIQQMFTAEDRLNYDTWELQRQHYLQFGSILHLIKHWSYGLIIFLIGNFGLILIPLIISIFKNSKKENIKILPIIFISIAFPLIFLQSGIVWNTIQVLTYARIPIIISVLLWLKNRPQISNSIIVSLILISIPSIFLTYQSVSNKELYINYSTKLIDSVKNIKIENKKYFLFDKQLNDSAFIPAISNINLYAADGTVISILNLDSETRIKEANKKDCKNNFIYLEKQDDQIKITDCK